MWSEAQLCPVHKFMDTDDKKIKAVVKKHWAGDADVFENMKHILNVSDAAIEFLPKKLIQMIRGISQ